MMEWRRKERDHLDKPMDESGKKYDSIHDGMLEG